MGDLNLNGAFESLEIRSNSSLTRLRDGGLRLHPTETT